MSNEKLNIENNKGKLTMASMGIEQAATVHEYLLNNYSEIKRIAFKEGAKIDSAIAQILQSLHQINPFELELGKLDNKEEIIALGFFQNIKTK